MFLIAKGSADTLSSCAAPLALFYTTQETPSLMGMTRQGGNNALV